MSDYEDHDSDISKGDLAEIFSESDNQAEEFEGFNFQLPNLIQ